MAKFTQKKHLFLGNDSLQDKDSLHIQSKMAKSITYLNVLYAQKDAAKALGARWDATNKKWYVPIGKDIAPFAQWHSDFVPQQTDNSAAPKQMAPKASTTKKTASANPNSGVFTYPSIPDFVPYAGEEPPWD